MSIKVMNRVWESSTHEGSTLLVLLALADHASDDGVCYPGIPRLARKARVSERHTKRLVTELEDSGEVYADRTGGRRKTSLYFIVLGFSEDEIVQTLAKRFEMPHTEAIKEARQIIEKRDRKGDTQDTLSGQKDDEGDTFSDEKGDIQGQERVTSASETVTPVSPKGDIAMSPEPSLTIINPSSRNHQKEPILDFPETLAPAPSKLTTFQQGDDPLTVIQKCASRREQANGNYAVPPSAGGSDGLADLALSRLYEFSGSEAPAEGKERDRQREKVAEVLKAYKCAGADPAVIEEAARLHCAAKGEFVNVYYKSFPADFGKYLGQAKAAHQKDAARRADLVEANEKAQAALDAKPKLAAVPKDDSLGWGIKDSLQAIMGSQGWPAYRDCVAPCSIYREDGTLHVVAPDEDTLDWVRGHAAPVIERMAEGLAVEYEVEG